METQSERTRTHPLDRIQLHSQGKEPSWGWAPEDADPERAGGRCLAGFADCGGTAALYFDLPICPECWLFSPTDAHVTYHTEAKD